MNTLGKYILLSFFLSSCPITLFGEDEDVTHFSVPTEVPSDEMTSYNPSKPSCSSVIPAGKEIINYLSATVTGSGTVDQASKVYGNWNSGGEITAGWCNTTGIDKAKYTVGKSFTYRTGLQPSIKWSTPTWSPISLSGDVRGIFEWSWTTTGAAQFDCESLECHPRTREPLYRSITSTVNWTLTNSGVVEYGTYTWFPAGCTIEGTATCTAVETKSNTGKTWGYWGGEYRVEPCEDDDCDPCKHPCDNCPVPSGS